MAYTPSPDDLTDLEMSPELRSIADGVLPFNRERMAEQMTDLSDAMRKIAVTFTVSAKPAIEAFGRLMRHITARAAWADYNARGRTRPDGRPRRTGHRHKGMPAWNRRHG